jgi:hypothetical protein
MLPPELPLAVLSLMLAHDRDDTAEHSAALCAMLMPLLELLAAKL